MTFGYLSSLNLIKITGEDANSFLQGQLTNDVNQLNNNWQLSAYCNPKGRVFALLYLWRINDCYYALIDSDICDTTIQRLSMYVLRSKVTIEKINASILGFASHADLQNCIPTIDIELVTQPESSINTLSNQETILTINGRYIFVDLSTKDSYQALTSFNSQWAALSIADGIPQITDDNSELYVPQMVNLDCLNAINFKKGCYTGQEIVARMHYLGNLKQRLFVCQIDTSDAQYAAINIGDKIYTEDSGEHIAGTVVNAAEGTNKLLAVLKLSNIQQPLYLKQQGRNPRPIDITSPQPYPLETKT